MNKLIIPTLALTTALTMGMVTTAPTYAYEDEGQTGFQSFIGQLAERFGLNQAEVETFVTTQQADRKEQMEKRHHEHLDSLVEEGVITQDQRKVLDAKHEEMMVSKEELSGLSRQELQALRQEHRSKMQEWAQDQGIDINQIKPERHNFGKHGFN